MKIKLCGTILTLSFLALYALHSVYTNFEGMDHVIASIPILLVWGLTIAWTVGHFKTKPYDAFNGGSPEPVLAVNPKTAEDITQRLNVAKTSFTRSSGHSKKHKAKK